MRSHKVNVRREVKWALKGKENPVVNRNGKDLKGRVQSWVRQTPMVVVSNQVEEFLSLLPGNGL